MVDIKKLLPELRALVTDLAEDISAVGDHDSRRFLNGARRLHFFQR